MTFLDDNYREIITKAVCGKGEQFSKVSHKVTPPHKPSSILGCWIINHQYKAKKISKNRVKIMGSYDINIWYSYHKNKKTEAMTECVSYTETIPLSERDQHCFGDDYNVIVKVTQQPNCLQCEISKCGKKIKVEVERGFTVKLIGETKVFVRVDPSYSRKDETYNFEFTDQPSKKQKPDMTDTKHES